MTLARGKTPRYICPAYILMLVILKQNFTLDMSGTCGLMRLSVAGRAPGEARLGRPEVGPV
jgi:hypothetical protein